MSEIIKERQTKTRKLVEKIFRQERRPLTLEVLHAKVKSRLPQTAYSTTYRLVARLEAKAILKRLDWRERSSRFEWAGAAHHHHWVCEECQTTICSNSSSIV